MVVLPKYRIKYSGKRLPDLCKDYPGKGSSNPSPLEDGYIVIVENTHPELEFMWDIGIDPGDVVYVGSRVKCLNYINQW